MTISNDFYKHITEKASDIIYTVTLDSKIKFLNKSVEDLFEATVEEIEKERFDHLMLPKDKELAKRLREERLKGESSIFEHGFITPKGKLVYLECSASPIFDKDKNIIGSLGIARDITERKLEQDELKESKEKLEEAIQLKDKFLSIISHDLRDPFNILIEYSDLILETFENSSPENIKKYIQAINTSSKNAFDLLNNLLNWSKSQTNEIRCSPEKLNITNLIDNTIRKLIHAASAKKISIHKNWDNDLMVEVDENMLNTVFRNILSNAIKFSYKNSEIQIELVEEKLQYIIKIVDKGIGIKEEELNKIFMSTMKNLSPGTNHERGTGLGLIICNEFVHKWGGRIWVDSTFGEGSTFSFSIPK